MKNFCLPKNKYTYWCFDMLFFTIGCSACYYLSVAYGLSTVLSSSLVGLVGSLIYFKYKDIQMAIYAGTFAGMSSPLVINMPLQLLLIGIIGGSVLSLSRKIALGLGGKLGASAFVSVLFLLALERIFL